MYIPESFRDFPEDFRNIHLSSQLAPFSLDINFGDLVWRGIQKMALESGFWVYFRKQIMSNSGVTE